MQPRKTRVDRFPPMREIGQSMITTGNDEDVTWFGRALMKQHTMIDGNNVVRVPVNYKMT